MFKVTKAKYLCSTCKDNYISSNEVELNETLVSPAS